MTTKEFIDLQMEIAKQLRNGVVDGAVDEVSINVTYNSLDMHVKWGKRLMVTGISGGE